jgi:prolipoprotein diacylglyceryl transferase
MTTAVLAYFPSPGQGVWYLGPFPIRAYALCIIAGIIAALIIGDRRWVARGGERGVIYDIALWAVPFGLVGGRLYHVMTDWRTYFGPDGAGIGAALRIWEGGLGIWGAVALGAVGAWIGCRRKGIPLPAFGDAVAPGVVLAQAIGRLGNYFNQELYGRETTVPWGLELFYRRDASGTVDVHSLDGVSTGQVAAVVHPTFLYELLWNLLVFVLLLWADRKFRLGHGRLFALYVAAYCVGRFGVELLRDDTATHIAGIRINVFTAAFVFIGAVLYLLLAPKGREDPETLRGWEDEEADPQESVVESVAEEWAEELVAAAKGSGILAAATVAGEHEAEDSAAVGDAPGAQAEFVTVGDTEIIPAVAAEESADAKSADAKSADGPVEDSLDEAATVIVDESVDGDTATEQTDREIAESEGPAEHVDPDAADTDEPDSKVPALIESADSAPVVHDSVVATFVLTDSVDTDPAVTAYVLTDAADSEPRAAEPAEAEPAAPTQAGPDVNDDARDGA